MVMLDTNIILRYLLNDDERMASEAEQSLDFPDCILYAYHKVKGYEVKTFDKKLNKLLKE